ncbi:MAG: N-6 DNA methylase [Candidatus Promineofilum sp.]|nr:N-6 DNA methylase [Promineifilum sp.]MBP9657990.1 N-6 DNA methylase [Promineifilum sp.]
MLDTDTKRRIDTARDILVGKVPDPKSQVEQITIALIYKFMDDMDAESEELGGVRTFFAGEFERYGWAKLMAPGIGGHEMLNLYAEAITRMPENPGIPALFRDIFKNAYLPYRDPETLKAFLKIIDEFSYDHSERLGDAFEYLLSVLGSQGAAGQFRTPRHIIDFMVAIVDPRKDERILDPACGTAGFLISAFKHIMAANGRDGKPGAALSPDERKRLMGNIHGYDISPDMVRLSLVNLYLHGFNDPHIDEYDTLTSEDRWNEYYNVILANPPFMSPKGGIKPHKRFSVQSNRSEVLFVDYIAEHLLPNGRAAVIVPEGVIFQSGNAYKQLRKLLVEEYLAGVISLPAGVFNPYSGVKTSILWLDKTIAKQTDSILFVKIEADGFDLGAQRKEIKRDDLPEVLDAIQVYKTAISGGQVPSFDLHPNLTFVSKDRIAEDGDYSLSGERYRIVQWTQSAYPIVPLSEVAEVIAGQSPPGESYNTVGEGLPFYQGKTEFEGIYLGKPKKWTTQVTKEAFADDVLMSVRAPVGPVNMATQHICIGRGLAAIRAKPNALPMYLFYMLRSLEGTITGNGGSVFDSISRNQIEELQIPLPPLAEQEAIVAEVESYQRIIDGARQVVENWRPRIEVDPEWPVVRLGEVCERIMDGTHFSPKNSTDNGTYKYITAKNIKEFFIDLSTVTFVSEEDHKAIYARCPVSRGDVLYVKDGVNAGIAAINSLDEEFSLLSSVAVLRPNPKLLDGCYLTIFLNTEEGRRIFLSKVSGVAITRLTLVKLTHMAFPLPDLETQRQIATQIEQERALIQSNRTLITRFEQKIKDRIARVWGN